MENLTTLKLKIEALIKLHQQLKYDNRQIKLQNKSLSNTIENQKLKITEIEKKQKTTKFEEPIKNTETRLKIDELVQEIDKCITLLK